VGKVTDEVFLQGLNSKLAKHAHYTSRKVRWKTIWTSFSIHELNFNSLTELKVEIYLYNVDTWIC
jgi:hypothetical protein